MRSNTPISRIMATKYLAIEICDTLQTVYDLFQQYAIDHIPVTDKGKFIGLIKRATLKSIRPSLYKSTVVKKAMCKQAIFLSPENSITSALEVFKVNFFKTIPIVDKHSQLVGVLSPRHLKKSIFDRPKGIKINRISPTISNFNSL